MLGVLGLQGRLEHSGALSRTGGVGGWHSIWRKTISKSQTPTSANRESQELKMW
jgi:hypothetical protein